MLFLKCILNEVKSRVAYVECRTFGYQRPNFNSDSQKLVMVVSREPDGYPFTFALIATFAHTISARPWTAEHPSPSLGFSVVLTGKYYSLPTSVCTLSEPEPGDFGRVF